MNFSEALSYAKRGYQIKHNAGLNKWLVLRDTPNGFRLVHATPNYGLVFWIPHQWEILAENWDVQEVPKCTD